MASREEEKERRRQEREAREQAAAGAAARKRRVQIVLGSLAALLVAGGVAFAVVSGTGDSDKKQRPDSKAVLPPKKSSDLDTAAQKAGCKLVEAKDEGNKHLPNKEATFDGYKTNPPTSGTHRPPPAAPDGFYDPGNTPDKEDWVHTLEHGRVIFQYAPGTPQSRIDQLELLMNEEFEGQPAGFKTVVMENNTKMPFAVAAVSWTRYVGCKEFTNDAFDVLRAFRSKYDGMAPEGDAPWPAS